MGYLLRMQPPGSKVMLPCIRLNFKYPVQASDCYQYLDEIENWLFITYVYIIMHVANNLACSYCW